MSDAVVPVQAPAKQKSNYWARAWRGELSLATAWWVNGFLLSGVLVGWLGVGIFNAIFNHTHATQFMAWAETAIYFVVVLAVYVWAIVGVWRSSANYHGPAVWKWLARFAICLGLLYCFRLMIVDLAVVHQAPLNGGHFVRR